MLSTMRKSFDKLISMQNSLKKDCIFLMMLDIQKDYKNSHLENSTSNDINILNENFITFDILKSKNDIEERCFIQNEVFYNNDREPLYMNDIINDIKQDYYIHELSCFIKIKNEPIGYGQIIAINNMYILVNFGILKKYRGLGFGEIFLDFLINKCTVMNINKLYLKVSKKNITALNLYSKAGFTKKMVINN